MKTAHERIEAERLAKQATPPKGPAPDEPELSVAGTEKRSGDSPERVIPHVTNASIRILGRAPAAEMTKRECFAAIMMAGLAFNGHVRRDENRASAAVDMADALIVALDASRLD
jgi:hypothetical protein